MSNEKKVIDLKPTTRAAIFGRTVEFFEAEGSRRDALAHLLGKQWSVTSQRYVKADHTPLIRVEDLTAKTANPHKYEALRAAYIHANDERFGAAFAGFTLAGISAMTTDDVKEHKLQLADGNKKPQTKAQIAKIEQFTKAQAKANNKISTGMADLRDTANVILAKPSRKSESAKSKTPTLPQPDTASGTDSTTRNVVDVEIESGTATEAKSILPPSIRDPRLLTILNTVSQYSLEEQARFTEVMIQAMKAFNK
jgi:hypothetical protein